MPLSCVMETGGCSWKQRLVPRVRRLSSISTGKFCGVEKWYVKMDRLMSTFKVQTTCYIKLAVLSLCACCGERDFFKITALQAFNLVWHHVGVESLALSFCCCPGLDWVPHSSPVGTSLSGGIEAMGAPIQNVVEEKDYIHCKNGALCR